MNFTEARARCHQDSKDVAVSSFLHLPMPRSDVENKLYFDLIIWDNNNAWLDITEIFPPTTPRSWVYKDESPIVWAKWGKDRDNYQFQNRSNVVLNNRSRTWETVSTDTKNSVICSYMLPPEADLICTWLREYEKSGQPSG